MQIRGCIIIGLCKLYSTFESDVIAVELSDVVSK